MLVATRSLTVRVAGVDRQMDVRVFRPIQSGQSWFCKYEIDWPEGIQKMEVGGFDSMQSLVLALHMIGADLHTSSYHKAGQLFFEAPGRGYGFPVPPNLRDQMTGDDTIFGA